MSTKFSTPGLLTELPEWESLRRAYQSYKKQQTNHKVILHSSGFDLDLSNQPYSQELNVFAEKLLQKRNFKEWQERLFTGQEVNLSEQRAAWHTALRAQTTLAEIHEQRDHLANWVAATQGTFKHIIHIGIGGSDWGPRLFINALGTPEQRQRIHFVSNIDGHAIDQALQSANPHDTLIIVSSKSFSTTETMLNAQRAFEWLKTAGMPISKHVVAVTTKPEKAKALGIETVFTFWDWVGGRYSVWSSIALPIALCLGIDTYYDMLRGAESMDKHFFNEPISANIPIQMALIGLIHRNINHYPSLNIAAYDSRLDYLAPYLQQLEMESLGKSVNHNGQRLNYHTGPIIWGMTGTDAQHTFFQWLHQGAEGAPVDFILCLYADHHHVEHHKLLVANCLAQRHTLKKGKIKAKNKADHADTVDAQHIHPGGRPSSLFVLERLNAYNLASLLAAYEHKVFTQAVLWGINPFDQWGVEEGKLIANDILEALDTDALDTITDASTAHWIHALQNTLNKNNS